MTAGDSSSQVVETAGRGVASSEPCGKARPDRPSAGAELGLEGGKGATKASPCLFVSSLLSQKLWSRHVEPSRCPVYSVETGFLVILALQPAGPSALVIGPEL